MSNEMTFVHTAQNRKVEIQPSDLFAIRLDDASTSGVTYVGKAKIGTAASDALWQIQKIDESGTPQTLVITWADGDSNFDNVWSNRTALTYL